MKKEQYTVIDLFAGCGGLSLGLYQAGWNGIFAVEKNPNAFETLNYNLIERKQHFAWPEWLPDIYRQVSNRENKETTNEVAQQTKTKYAVVAELAYAQD